MRKFLLLSLVLFSTALYSQPFGTIRGTITDKEMNSEPLLFAEVALKTTDKTAHTNFHGNFEITDVIPGNYTLVVNYPGYEPIKISVAVKENTVVDINREMLARKILVEDIIATAADLAGKEKVLEKSSSQQD